MELARQGSFDSLRLAFVLLVVYTHSIRILPGHGYPEFMDFAFGRRLNWRHGTGDLAVYGFFVLSGFLITMSWDRSRNAWSYLRNRMLRIYPGFVVASLVSVLFVAPLAAPTIQTWWQELSPLRTLGHILRLKPPDATVFVGTIHPELNTSMWSISHEFRCYLLVGLAGIVVPARFRVWFWGLLLGVCAVILGSGWVMPAFPLRDTILGGDENEAYLVGSFAAGALYYHLMPWHHRFRQAFPLVAILLLVCLIYQPLLPVAIPVVLSVFLLQIGLSRRLGRLIPKPPIDISYGTYLYAWPIQKLLIHAWPGISLWTHVVASSVLALGCGWLSWTWVESRFMKLKAR